MAFERMLASKPRYRSRFALGALSLAAHAAAFGGLTIRSYWSVEEVAPPAIRIEFTRAFAAPLPPPDDRKPKPRPRPAGRASGSRNLAAMSPAAPETSDTPPVAHETVSRPPASTQGADDGLRGDAPSATGDGHDAPASVVPPAIASARCRSCAPPTLPAPLLHMGGERSMLAKICVGLDGAVRTVTILRGIDPSADPRIVATLHGWRFEPYAIEGRPVPFCYVAHLRFVIE
jgi:hypothetical protein